MRQAKHERDNLALLAECSSILCLQRTTRQRIKNGNRMSRSNKCKTDRYQAKRRGGLSSLMTRGETVQLAVTPHVYTTVVLVGSFSSLTGEWLTSQRATASRRPPCSGWDTA